MRTRRVHQLLLAALTGVVTPAIGQAWRVIEQPATVIGASASDPRDQFVRVLDAVLLPDGEIAVLDAGIPAVRLYDRTGRWDRDLGRLGGGPGEFREPIALTPDPRGIGILSRDGRLEVLDLSGRSVESTRVPLNSVRGERFNTTPVLPLPGGNALLKAAERMFGATRGEYRQEVGLLLAGRGEVRDTVGWFPGDSGRADGTGAPVPRPYLPSTGLLFDGSSDLIAAMTADEPLVQVYSGSGQPIARWRAPLARPLLDSRDVTRVIADATRGLRGNDARVVAEWEAGRPRSQRAPIAARVLVGAGEEPEVWIEQWGRPNRAATWLVLSAQGRPLSAITLPPGLELLDVLGDTIIGLMRDADDVETVVRYTLQRGR